LNELKKFILDVEDRRLSWTRIETDIKLDHSAKQLRPLSNYSEKKNSPVFSLRPMYQSHGFLVARPANMG
jgi:hypothetical protein